MTMLKKRLLLIFIAALLAAVLPSGLAQAQTNGSAPAAPAAGAATASRFENEYRQFQAMQFDAVKNAGYDFLRRKKLQKLQETAVAVKAQRLAMQDFEGFFQWMSANLAGYNRFIQASSYVASAAKILPIPYAGQVSNFTRFVSQFTVTLNNASLSATRYMNSSQKFAALVEAINPAGPLSDQALAEAHLFADRQLLPDMSRAEKDLSAIGGFSAATLSFLTGLSLFASETTNYWKSVKEMVKKDVDQKDKSYLTASINALKAQTERFEGRLTLFRGLTQKATAIVSSLVIYDELAAEISLLK